MLMIENIKEKELSHIILAIAGVFIYCFGVNYFIIPMGLYSGGILGISQLIRTFLSSVVGIDFGSLDISGIIYYCFNIPLIYLAYRIMPKIFVIKLFIITTLTSLFFSLIPIPEIPIIEDRITNCITGGIVCGFGLGVCLRNGCSSGGSEIIGIYFIQKGKNTGIGQVNMLINAVIYAICLIVFDINTAIYSIIYSVISSLVIDKVHTQTINVEAIIISESGALEIEKEIMEKLRRGVTYWEGYGGYTNKQKTVMYTIISKYEVATLKKIIKNTDPHAFAVFKEGVGISGNFKKRL